MNYNAIILALPALLVLLLGGCGSETYSGTNSGSSTGSYTGVYEDSQADGISPPAYAPSSAHGAAGMTPQAHASGSAVAGGNRVAILDHGLRMTRGTQVIPDGWNLVQHIATDPSSGHLSRYVFDVRGPGGILSRGMGTKSYAEMMGTSLEQAWRELAIQGLQEDVQDLSFGNLRRSLPLERLPQFQKALQRASHGGYEIRGLEAPVRGSVNGQPVEGVVYIVNYTSSHLRETGSVQVSALISPPDKLEDAVRINEQMAASYEPDPLYEQRMEQIAQMARRRQEEQHQQWMSQSRAQHQQRMADNQARFQSHQRTMQDRYDANDQQHQAWMDNFQNSGTSAWSGNDYTGHEAFIDATHERTTFQDPYTGQHVQRDGNYDNWYTNGQGEYYGTDDPSFDPYSVEGNWQQIEPLQPNP